MYDYYAAMNGINTWYIKNEVKKKKFLVQKPEVCFYLHKGWEQVRLIHVIQSEW